jgi:hypothetical protein
MSYLPESRKKSIPPISAAIWNEDFICLLLLDDDSQRQEENPQKNIPANEKFWKY